MNNGSIVAAVCKHIVAQQVLAGGGEDVGIEEAADSGVIVSALQVIEPGLFANALAICLFLAYHTAEKSARKSGQICVIVTNPITQIVTNTS